MSEPLLEQVPVRVAERANIGFAGVERRPAQCLLGKRHQLRPHVHRDQAEGR